MAAPKDHHLVLKGQQTDTGGQSCVAYSKCGNTYLVSCGAGGAVCLHDGRTGAVKASTASEGVLKNGACNILAHHPSGFVAVGGEHAVKVSFELDSQLSIRLQHTFSHLTSSANTEDAMLLNPSACFLASSYSIHSTPERVGRSCLAYYVGARVCAHTLTRTCTHTHTHLRVHIHIHVHVHTYTYT